MALYKVIKISNCRESSTNPRGPEAFTGPAFDDLVASVKEKGVLMPILVRLLPRGSEFGFEIVAGARRFRAAKAAGHQTIPAQIREMSDEEAREVQIIENLQRADMHPLDEGAAYRALINNSPTYNLTSADIAMRIGKSVSYVRLRLVLTDLAAAGQTALRKNKISLEHATLIARLNEKDQAAAIKYCNDRWAVPTVADLREWIQKRTFKSLMANQPWTNDAELKAAVGPCQECPPEKAVSLFGERAPGACTDPLCFARKLAAYIEIKKRELAAKKIPVTLVSSFYSPETKGILGAGSYKELEGKESCKSQHTALVVEGEETGKVIQICTDKNCAKHGSTLSHEIHKPTKKELAARKTARAREAAAEKKRFDDVSLAAGKVKSPLAGAQLNILLELVLSRSLAETVRDVVKHKGWEVKHVKQPYYDRPQLDYEGALRREAALLTDTGRLQLIFELSIWNASWDAKEKGIVNALLHGKALTKKK